MAASDELKKIRSQGYDRNEADNDPDQPNDTSRTIKLMDEEMKSLEPYQIKPGENIVLEVTGNLEQDGHFHVMTVKYAQGKGDGNSDEQMAQEVAGRVSPNLQISPS